RRERGIERLRVVQGLPGVPRRLRARRYHPPRRGRASRRLAAFAEDRGRLVRQRAQEYFRALVRRAAFTGYGVASITSRPQSLSVTTSRPRRSLATSLVQGVVLPVVGRGMK